MITLEQGYLTIHGEYVRASGYALGHPKIDDGVFVNTSRIVKISTDDNTIYFTTFSGSQYQLRCIDIDIERLADVKASLEKFGVSFDVKRCRTLIQENENRICRDLSGVVRPCELYLRMLNEEAVTHAYYMDANGRLLKADIQYHSGTFQDSILISVYGICDFRFFPKCMEIEPYHWSKGLKAVKIYSLCNDFAFRGSFRCITCKVGTITTIEAKEYTGEGLMYPDSVSGKSMLTESSRVFGM